MNRQEHAGERDSLGKMARRVANPAHSAGLLKRGAACWKERGAEAVLREISYRINLLTRGEDWRFRADLPLKRELRAQKAHQMQYMPLVSIVVPVYNTPMKFFRQLVKSVKAQKIGRAHV